MEYFFGMEVYDAQSARHVPKALRVKQPGRALAVGPRSCATDIVARETILNHLNVPRAVSTDPICGRRRLVPEALRRKWRGYFGCE